MMNNSIYPCITLKGQVSAAADFYIHTFGEGKIVQTSPYVIQIELSGQYFMLLNEGPASTLNPAISFMVMTASADETEQYWNKLIDGGQVMMPLDSYDWSEKYGWVQDKFGVSWQLYTGTKEDNEQKFCPTLMFTGPTAGKTNEAIDFYTHLFPESSLTGVMNYAESDGEPTDFVKHAQFKLRDYTLMAMDSSAAHGFVFNDAISMVVLCDTQEEIDKYWDILTADGGKAIQCGWLTDKFGISWQIVPSILGTLVKDPARAQRVMAALMKMTKLIIKDLENA